MVSHNGIFGFCSSTVPNTATVCTGCGAHWGVLLQKGNGHRWMATLKEAKEDARTTSLMLPLYLTISAILFALIWINIEFFTFSGWTALLLLMEGIIILITLTTIPVSLKAYLKSKELKEQWWKL